LYHIFDSDNYEEYGVSRDPDLPDGISFLTGKIIEESLAEPLEFFVDNPLDIPLADFTELVIPVMSNKLVTLLKNAGIDNLQIFRALLHNPDTGQNWTNYQAVNIIGTIACADMEQSKYIDAGGAGIILVHFEKLVVNCKKTHGALLFRLAESPDKILIHEKVMGEILRHEPKMKVLFKPVNLS